MALTQIRISVVGSHVGNYLAKQSYHIFEFYNKGSGNG